MKNNISLNENFNARKNTGHPYAAKSMTERTYEDRIRQLEELLKNKTKQLEDVCNDLEEFSHALAHDIKAPLRAIRSFSEILREEQQEKLDAEGKRILEIIESNSKKLTQLIDGMLTYTGITNRRAVYKPVNMKLLAENCLDALLTNEQKKRYTIFVDELPGCCGDENMLKQVWINLLGNAIKYSSKKMNPTIEAGFEKDDMTTIYFVRDKGVGFDMAYSNKLFQPFQRLHSENEFEGTGVGLAFVKRVILKHSGSIWVQSIPEEGSTFYFSIPNKINGIG